MNQALVDAGYKARPNEPWSGKQGFMYSADMHAKAHNAEALMIEARQDLLVQDAWRAQLVQHLAKILKGAGY